jgi:hypothetical protein
LPINLLIMIIYALTNKCPRAFREIFLKLPV